MDLAKLAADFIINLFTDTNKRTNYEKIWEHIEEKIIPIAGAHRVILAKITNGGSSLKYENDMFLTLINKWEDTRYLKEFPMMRTIKIDSYFRGIIRRIVNEKKIRVQYGSTDGMLFEFMSLYGVNYAEYYLIKSEEKKAVILVLSSEEIEVDKHNPFDEHRLLLEIEIDKLKKI